MDRDSAPNVKIAGDARWKTHPCGGAYAFVGRVPQWDKEKPVMAAGAGRRHAKKRRKENALFVGKRFLFANTRETRGGAAVCAQEGVELVWRFGAAVWGRIATEAAGAMACGMRQCARDANRLARREHRGCRRGSGRGTGRGTATVSLGSRISPIAASVN